MLGAGIFVFPGLAANETGPSAMLSFGIAGLAALLVAACTAELATAMPRSGGAYFYVSRIFGEMTGSLVGIAQSIGLVFASAFYLVAFADYSMNLLGISGAQDSWIPVAIASGTALLLTLVNVIGSKESGSLQFGVVIILIVLLSIVFGAGLLDAAGITAERQPLPDFAPFVTLPILTTAAFVFTSFLGFVQISTVAGEVRNPGRTLPAALIGSVVVVTLLYVVALFVTTSMLSPERLVDVQSEATIELGRVLFGDGGRMLIVLAGLFATLSSANASILSSSRTLYALGNDDLAPAWSARINARFGTPHFALLVIGIGVGTLTFLGNLKFLAEVASVLHLLIYGLICAALIRKRSEGAEDYSPSFRIPFARLIAGAGIVGCTGLVLLMEPNATMTGGVVLLAALTWYAIRRRLKGGARPSDK